MSYEKRSEWDYFAWPELAEAAQRVLAIIIDSASDKQLIGEVFVVASQAAGCVHCQAHGAYTLFNQGMEVERIRDLWLFEESDRFNEREKSALRFTLAASVLPNAVTPEHHAELRKHFNDQEVRTLFAMVSWTAFMNRWNDSLATVTYKSTSEWAHENLTSVGWKLGKHDGPAGERRPENNVMGQYVRPHSEPDVTPNAS